MKLTLVVSVAAAALLLLAGCSASTTLSGSPSGEPSTPPSATPSPTPTIDPGPVALSKEEAAQRFLGVVCQRNRLVNQLDSAFDAQEQTFLNGGSADPSEVKVIAADAQRVNRLAIEIIDDPYYVWPTGVASHIRTIRQAYIELSSYYDGVMNADSFEEAYYLDGLVTDGATAAQEIRYQLGLPADTSSSCEGKETISESLHQEMLERNEYLASFVKEEVGS